MNSCIHEVWRYRYMLIVIVMLDFQKKVRVSTIPGNPRNPGNLLEFKDPPGNLEYNGPPGNFCVRWSTAFVSGHNWVGLPDRLFNKLVAIFYICYGLILYKMQY